MNNTIKPSQDKTVEKMKLYYNIDFRFENITEEELKDFSQELIDLAVKYNSSAPTVEAIKNPFYDSFGQPFK